MSTRTRLADLFGDLRQPEYTGENRCLPCTATNVVIAAVLALGLAAVLVTPLGILAFLASLGVIYVRGYLVPGTPELTKQYFPPWLLSLFGKDTSVENVFDVSGESSATDATTEGTTADAAVTETPETSGRDGSTTTETTDRDRSTGTATAATTAGTVVESAGTGSETVGSETPDEAVDTGTDGPLFAANVVTRSDSDEIVLTPSFQEAWRDRIAAVREAGVEPADVRTTFDADAIRRTGELSFVIDSSASVRWESTAALVADVAAAALLRERLEGWRTIEKDDRTATLTGLRLFLENCPTCGGAIVHDHDRVDPCCQKPHLVANATCGECGSQIADAAVVDSGDGSSVRVRLLRV